MTEVRVRHKGASEDGLIVNLIHTWQREDFESGYIMGNSGGPKPTIRNLVAVVFAQDPDVVSVSMVRANGPPFLILRKGTQYFDVAGKEVEVAQRRAVAAVSKVRPAELAV